MVTQRKEVAPLGGGDHRVHPLERLQQPVGDLLVAIIASDGNPTLTGYDNGFIIPNFYNKLGQASNSTVVTGAVFWRVATSTLWANENIGVSSSASEQFSGAFYRFRGTSLKIDGVSSNGSSTNSDPGNLSSTTDVAGLIDGTAKDYLWIATRSGDSTTVATVAPTNYTNLLTQAGGGTNGASSNCSGTNYGSAGPST